VPYVGIVVVLRRVARFDTTR